MQKTAFNSRVFERQSSQVICRGTAPELASRVREAKLRRGALLTQHSGLPLR